jgi:hypothetical protein
MAFGPGVYLVLMMGSVGAGCVLLAGALIAWRTGRGRLALGCIGGGVGLAGLYLATLCAVSLASPCEVLARGEVKRFCGVYLDCHVGVSVDDVRTAASVGAPERPVVARGRFRIVTLRVSSNARRATLSPYDLLAIAVDSTGRHFRRDRDAERALLGEVADRPLEQAVEAGGSYTRTLVFDVPADAQGLALSVTEQGFPDVLIEALLIGDEDSLLHPPTLLSLAATSDAGMPQQTH